MEKLQQLSGYLKNKDAEGEVYTVPLSESDKILEEIFAGQVKCFMLFTSDKNKDGKEWCPYCVNIKPYYNQVYDEISKTKLPFYIFIVGDQPTWKDPNHAFRKKKNLLITSVPTFGYFNGKKLTSKIGGTEMVQESQRQLVYESI